MGWWSRRSEGGNAVGMKAFTDLVQRQDTLERGFRSMRMEWEDVYDKLMKAAARLNARTRREKQEDAPPLPVEPGQQAPHITGSHGQLAAARARRAGTP